MPRVATRVPELSEVLCYSCGYVLDGLPQTGVCPECGNPISTSLGADRQPPEWETAVGKHRSGAFVRTSARIIFKPKAFYRTLNVRGPLEPARDFARIHWVIASALFGATAALHVVSFAYQGSWWPDFPGGRAGMTTGLAIVLFIVGYAGLSLITRLASRLTNVEATYRGIRLPYNIVLRGLYYHAGHYFPVALIAFVYVGGCQLAFFLFEHSLPINSPMDYLYGLCGLVVICAIYLFQTYWIGMRNMMYANR